MERLRSFVTGRTALLALVCAGPSAVALAYLFRMKRETGLLLSSLVALVCFVLLAALFLYAYGRRKNFGLRKMCVAFGCALAFSAVVGTFIEATSETGLVFAKSWILMVLLVPGFTAGFQAVTAALLAPGARTRELSERSESSKGKAQVRAWLAHGQRTIVLTTLLIFLLWVPVFLAFYPGIYGYDSIYQVAEVVGGAGLTSHHPVLHTLLLNGSILFGMNVLGSDALGFACYIVLQMAVMAIAFAVVCFETLKISRSRVLFVLAVAWFALCPVNSIFAISSTKDILFTGFFCLSAVAACEGATRSGRRAVPFAVLFVITASLMLLLRNNAIYAYLVLLVIIAVVLVRKRRVSAMKQFGAPLLLPLVIALVLMGPVSSALGVTSQNSMRESLSVPLQQLARVRVLHSDELTEQQKDYIDKLIPTWSDYMPGNSDPVKNHLNRDYLSAAPLDFAEVYFTLGAEHPIAYTESLLLNTYGFWYPDTTSLYLGGWFYHHFMDVENSPRDAGDNYHYIDTDSKLPGLRAALSFLVEKRAWGYVPGLSVLMNPGSQVWFYAFALYVLMCARRTEKAELVPIVFLLLYWGTNLLGPCLLVRYLYPLYAYLPMLPALLMEQRRRTRDALEGDERAVTSR